MLVSVVMTAIVVTGIEGPKLVSVTEDKTYTNGPLMPDGCSVT